MNTEKLTERSREALERAIDLARGAGHAEITPLHLLGALLEQGDTAVRPLIESVGGNAEEVQDAVVQALRALPRLGHDAPPRLSQELQNTLERSASGAYGWGRNST